MNHLPVSLFVYFIKWFSENAKGNNILGFGSISSYIILSDFHDSVFQIGLHNFQTKTQSETKVFHTNGKDLS